MVPNKGKSYTWSTHLSYLFKVAKLARLESRITKFTLESSWEIILYFVYPALVTSAKNIRVLLGLKIWSFEVPQWFASAFSWLKLDLECFFTQKESLRCFFLPYLNSFCTPTVRGTSCLPKEIQLKVRLIQFSVNVTQIIHFFGE